MIGVNGRRYTVQPRGPARAVPGLLALASPNNRILQATRAPMTISGTPGVATAGFGLAWDFAGGGQYIDLGALPASLSRLSLLCVCRVNQADTFPASSRSGSLAQGVEFCTGIGGVAGRFNTRLQSSSAAVSGSGVAGLNDGNYHTMMVTWTSGTGPKFWVDGDLRETLSSLSGSISSSQNLRIASRATTYLTGQIGLAAFWPTDLSDIAGRLTLNAWQTFRSRGRLNFGVPAAGGAIDLVVEDTLHAHTADGLTLTQLHVLTVADASHAHLADAVTLTQTHILALADALHAHAADNVVLSVAGTLAVDDALHAHAADGVVLTQVHVLDVADALHAQLADNVTLAVGGTTLAIADALHAHLADGPALTQLHILTVSDALHAHLADTLTLSVPGAAILHDRVLIVRGENRTLVILPESRVFAVPGENRTLTLH